MKIPFAICAISVLTGMTVSGNRGDIRDRFAGAWRLAWLERPGADGRPHRVDTAGMFIFTRDSRSSVHVVERNRPAPVPAGREPYSRRGHEASWGTYKVDEPARTFTFHVEGALICTLVGKDLPARTSLWAMYSS